MSSNSATTLFPFKDSDLNTMLPESIFHLEPEGEKEPEGEGEGEGDKEEKEKSFFSLCNASKLEKRKSGVFESYNFVPNKFPIININQTLTKLPEDTEADVIEELADTVYSNTDSDIYTNFSRYKTLSIREILEKIKNGEISGAACYGNYSHSYGRIISSEEKYPLYNDIKDVFDQSKIDANKSVARPLINSKVIYNNESRDYYYLARVNLEYYLICSSKVNQAYSWEKINISQDYIELYKISEINEKVKYAIKQIMDGLHSFSMPQLNKNIKALKSNVEINSENVDTLCSELSNTEYLIKFLWTSSVDESKYIIWIDHNKLFGWYPYIEPITYNEDDDWVTLVVKSANSSIRSL
jgi:hypothetical protein